MVIDTTLWGVPQWTVVIWMALSAIGHVLKHGEARPAYNGWGAAFDFLITAILLSAGGFFS